MVKETLFKRFTISELKTLREEVASITTTENVVKVIVKHANECSKKHKNI